MAKVNYKLILLCCISALFLMVICFYNGYPLYGGDTHAYLHSAFDNWIPQDRPPFYGKFISLTSLGISLWSTIFIQCSIVSCLLVRYMHLLNSGRMSMRFGILCMVFITAFTCVSWICAYMIPDIFTGILLLTILLYLWDKKATRLVSAFYVLLITLAVMVHNSHFLLIILFSFLVLVYSFVKKNKTGLIKGMVMFAVGVLFYFSMCMLNKRYDQGFTFSPSSKVFIIARFASNGILEKYLDDHCGKKNLRLCTCKGQLPADTYSFMWPDSSSPLLKTDVWGDSSKKEYKGIILDVFTTPEYLRMYIGKSINSTFQQLCSIGVEKPFAFPADNWKILMLKTYFSSEYKELSGSKQNANVMETAGFNFIYTLFFVISSLLILVFYPYSAYKELYHIYAGILVFIVINAFTSSNFSMVSPRFQNRVFWVLPATNTILILKFLQSKYKVLSLQKTNDSQN